MSALEQFSQPTQAWFSASFGAPTPAQEGAWDAVARGENALVVAPTGSGKTLSAFLWAIDRLMASPQPPEGTRVLYISPLKALGVDIERNLRSPLVGIGHAAQRLGTSPQEITVGVRTGDSTSKQRRDLVRQPPHILITTPESLYLMLTSQARSTLGSVDTVIVDEIHALAGSKRGAHLAVSLERLDALLQRPAQRIGLSATVEPQTEVARFLGGRQQVTVVNPPAQKSWELTVAVPVQDLASPSGDLPSQTDESQPLQPSIWPHVEHQVVDLIRRHRSTIVFVNSRRLAEKLTGKINEIWSHQEPEGEDPAKSHHGSVSKEQRGLIEDDLKSGKLRCVVATSSLELGIDMGSVDLVVQVESPPAVSAGLQRVGRAGHQVGEVSVGWFLPKHRGDLLSTAVVVERMLGGQIEALRIPRNPLDILAQQTIATASMDTVDVEEWFETLRRSAPFSSLPRSVFEATVDLLAGKYPSDRFADLRPRVVWDRDSGTISGRPGAQRLAVTSGGTIPDRGLFGVYLVGAEDSRTGGRRVGELDEEMVYESRVGDVFALGATSWRIEEITFDRVMVSPAFGQPASLPFWRGDGLGRPSELGQAMGRFSRELREVADHQAQERLTGLGLDEWARENLLRYLSEQQEATGAVPTDTTLVVERTKDELGDWRIILHSPYGLQVHAPWALAVGERLHQLYGLDGAAFAADDGIVLRVPMMDDDPPGADLFVFAPEELEELVTRQVSSSALFAGRFREAAARALLLPRQSPGQRTPLWQQRQRSSQLLEVAHQFPDFPMIIEAMREVLQDVYDLPALDTLTRQIAQRTVRMVEATTIAPSPFAQSILFGYIAQYLYEGDSPLAERRAAALSVDPHLLNELLGRVELREFLDTEVIEEVELHAQRLSPTRWLSGVEGAADLLRLVGPLAAEQLAQRLNDPDAPENGTAHAPVRTVLVWMDELVKSQRAVRISWQAQERFAAVEDAARLRDGLGINIPPGVPQTFMDPVDDPLGDLIGRYARTHRPFTGEEAAAALGLPWQVVQEVLARLVETGQVVEGQFTPEKPAELEYVDADLLRRIRRRSLAALRAAVEPVPPRAYATLLTQWQSAAPGHQTEGRAGLAEVLAQLSALPAPASAWESFILPARVSGYQPALLDELLNSGEVVIIGRGALTGHDGWIQFTTADDLHILPPANEEHRPTEQQQQVLDVLSHGGAWFPSAIAARLNDNAALRTPVSTAESDAADSAAAEPMSTKALTEVLWDLFWAGRVHPDSFSALRAFMKTGSTAHRRRNRSVSTRHRSRRTALRQALSATRAQHSSTRHSAKVSGAAHVDEQAAGRWALTPQPHSDPTEVAHLRAEILLERYGVLTRGSVTAEQTPGGFAGVYKVLSTAEDAGHIRRGYFIEHLGAAQFTSSAMIDRLRETADHLDDGRVDSTIVLAATDPANPYGAALDWPTIQSAARPGRKAGAVVVLHNGDLVLYMERGGRTMLLYTEDGSVMDQAAEQLTQRLRAAGSGRIALERVNGSPILKHRLAQSLKEAGFHSSPSGLRFAP